MGHEPWSERDPRILIPWMRSKRCGKRIRRHFLAVLGGKEYQHLVVQETRRLPFKDYMQLLSKHSFVLSPPGKGYDCSRTWESIFVGSVPLVYRDPLFDQRLFSGSTAAYIPGPEELSPSRLEELLLDVPEPAKVELLGMEHWSRVWRSFLE
eukprot:5380441-Amphidinium_carterae.2